MNYYLRWTESNIDNIGKLGLKEIFTEVDESGFVLREIGFGDLGVLHKAPTKMDPRGLFDLAKISTDGLQSAITSDQFEIYWKLKIGDQKPG